MLISDPFTTLHAFFETRQQHEERIYMVSGEKINSIKKSVNYEAFSNSLQSQNEIPKYLDTEYLNLVSIYVNALFCMDGQILTSKVNIKKAVSHLWNAQIAGLVSYIVFPDAKNIQLTKNSHFMTNVILFIYQKRYPQYFFTSAKCVPFDHSTNSKGTPPLLHLPIETTVTYQYFLDRYVDPHKKRVVTQLSNLTFEITERFDSSYDEVPMNSTKSPLYDQFYRIHSNSSRNIDQTRTHIIEYTKNLKTKLLSTLFINISNFPIYDKLKIIGLFYTHNRCKNVTDYMKALINFSDKHIRALNYETVLPITIDSHWALANLFSDILIALPLRDIHLINLALYQNVKWLLEGIFIRVNICIKENTQNHHILNNDFITQFTKIANNIVTAKFHNVHRFNSSFALFIEALTMHKLRCSLSQYKFLLSESVRPKIMQNRQAFVKHCCLSTNYMLKDKIPSDRIQSFFYENIENFSNHWGKKNFNLIKRESLLMMKEYCSQYVHPADQVAIFDLLVVIDTLYLLSKHKVKIRPDIHSKHSCSEKALIKYFFDNNVEECCFAQLVVGQIVFLRTVAACQDNFFIEKILKVNEKIYDIIAACLDTPSLSIAIGRCQIAKNAVLHLTEHLHIPNQKLYPPCNMETSIY